MKKLFYSKNLLFLLALTTFILSVFDRDKGLSVILNSKTYLLEMLFVLPPILILIGLFQVWVPRTTVEKAMGRTSGLRGILMAVFLGTAAMGPLYVTFPLAVSLLKKGASLFNTTIFLCVWASIKILMILFEIKFLGFNFACFRLGLTLPSIIIISFLVNIILKGRNFYEKAETF